MTKTNDGFWLGTGLIIGSFVGMGLLHIFETECIDTDIIIGGE